MIKEELNIFPAQLKQAKNVCNTRCFYVSYQDDRDRVIDNRVIHLLFL